MKKFLGALLGVALLAGPASAQTVLVPTVQSISPGADLVQIIPGGKPQPGNQYASVVQLLTGTTNASGLPGTTLPLTNFKTGAGIGMTASAGAGVFGVAITAGTSEDLIGEAALSNTKTDTAAFEYVLPPSYVAGQNITVTVNCNYNLGSGTIGTHTLTGNAYLTTSAGVQGSSLIATAAQTVPSAAGTVNFTITGTSLVPGSRLWITLAMAIQDTGGSNITGQINSVLLK